MSAFEFFFGFFSLIMGLAAVTLAAGLADVLKSRQAVKVGLLTPLLAVFMLMDISTFWAIGWKGLQSIEISYATIYLGLGMSLSYFLAASLVFPKDASEWPSLDDYYQGHKRLALAGVFVANSIGLSYRIVWGDFDGMTVVQGARLALFFAALAALMLARNRALNIGLLLLLCLLILSPALVPSTADTSGA